jgi:hypothetical protein
LFDGTNEKNSLALSVVEGQSFDYAQGEITVIKKTG